jgi:hypothetical protein
MVKFQDLRITGFEDFILIEGFDLIAGFDFRI